MYSRLSKNLLKWKQISEWLFFFIKKNVKLPVILIYLDSVIFVKMSIKFIRIIYADILGSQSKAKGLLVLTSALPQFILISKN